MKPTVYSRSRIKPWSLLTALCLTLSLASFTGLDPAMAQEQRLRTLTVTGQGIISVPTALTQVRLGVEIQAKTAEEAQQEAAKRSAAVVNFLQSRNVDKLETTGIQLNPIYNYQNNQQIITGYAAINTVSFRIDTKKAGTILDEAVKAGATRIDGVSFIASDEVISAAQQQALRAATQNAQTQANTVLSALNLTQQGIVGVQINSVNVPPPIMLERFAAAKDQAATPVIGGEQQVQASVTLEISY